MAEINLGKVKGDDVTKQSITSALGFPVKEIVFISQSEYDALLPEEQEGERLFFIRDKLGKIFYKNELIWELPWDGTFADPLVGQILFDAGLIADPTQSTLEELAGITSIDSLFADSEITSFDEFKYFTGVTSLGAECFKMCRSLTSITLPESLTSIGDSCFYVCSVLTSINIPEGVTSIGEACFQSCSELASINIPESLTSIGDKWFLMCRSLTSITLPESVTSLGASCFHGCVGLASINIPESVTSIGASCFNGCSSLTSINIPEGVTSLESSCFYGCSSFTSINIPESVTSLGASCFYYCGSLTSITLPESLTSIGNNCFRVCTSLTLATVLHATPPTLGTTVFDSTHESFIIKVGSAYVNAYKTATNWSAYADKISAI